MSKEWNQRLQRLSQIVEVGGSDDIISHSYDIFSTAMLIIHLIVTILYAFYRFSSRPGQLPSGCSVL